HHDVVGLDARLELPRLRADAGLLPEVAHRRLRRGGEPDLLPDHGDVARLVPAIEQDHGARAVGEGLHPDFLHAVVAPPASRPLRPCMPSGSWSTAITSVFVRMSSVSREMLRRSLPAMSGAARSAQKLKWARDSDALRPPLPTSSMSGSFQWPGPAEGQSAAFRAMMRTA